MSKFSSKEKFENYRRKAYYLLLFILFYVKYKFKRSNRS